MKLFSDVDVQQTLEKIAILERQYERVKSGDTELNDFGRELSMVGLRRTINQMKEDIVRYRSRLEAVRKIDGRMPESRGMTYDKIKEYHERRPFLPFDIRTSDGRVYTVDRPEFLMQSRNRNVVTFTTEDDRDVVIDVSRVTSLEATSSPAA